MSHGIDRRKFVKGVGSATILGTAGCLGGGGDGDGGGNDTDNQGNGTGGGETTTTSGNETGNASGGGGGNVESRTIRLGVLQPLTGDLGSVGQPIARAAELPAKQLESADTGGLSFEFQTEDTAATPQQGISAANTLMNAGFPMVTGAASSGVTTQVMEQVFVPNSIVACSPASTAPSLTNLEDNNLFWRTAPNDDLQGDVLAQVTAERRGASTAATMYTNNDYGQGLAESFKQTFESEYGGTVQNEVSFAQQQASYTARLENALSGNPDALVIIGYPQSGTQIFTDYYNDFSGAVDSIVVTDGLQDPEMQRQLGNPMENVVGTAPAPEGPNVDAFRQLFQDEYDSSPGIFTSHAYDASATLILASAAAGEDNGSAIAEQMQAVTEGGTEVGPDNLAEGVTMAAQGEDVNYQGASSQVQFDDNGDVVGVKYDVWQFAPNSESGIEVLETVTIGSE